jgi:NADH-quinone oxidoreductase subunit N
VSSVILFLPLLLVLVGGLAVMLLDAFGRERAELALVSTVVLLTALLFSAVALSTGATGNPPEFLTRYLAVDRMALFFDVVITGGAALATLLAGGYLREHVLERGEMYLLLLFSALGGMVLARAVDILTVFIGLETLSLGVYAMVAFRRTSAAAVEGAMKYFLLGSFGAAILLFGMALLYGATGHTDFAGIGAAIASGDANLDLLVPALPLVIVGIAFKVSAFPFHMWTPDAYEGAVSPATVFMSVVVKSAAFALMLRVLVGVFGSDLVANARTGWPFVIATLAVLSMLYGNIAAMQQTSIKRMLAYSSIAHAGYAMLGVASAHAAGETAVSAVLFYMLAYTVSNVLAFGGLIALGSYGLEAVSYEDIEGVGRRHPLASLPLALGALSLMGFPPTAGFFAKYYVLSSAVEAGGYYVGLALVAVLASLLGAVYYLRILVAMYFRTPKDGAPLAIPMRSGYVATAVMLAGYFVLRMGTAPSFYLDLARDAARQFLG